MNNNWKIRNILTVSSISESESEDHLSIFTGRVMETYHRPKLHFELLHSDRPELSKVQIQRRPVNRVLVLKFVSIDSAEL